MRQALCPQCLQSSSIDILLFENRCARRLKLFRLQQQRLALLGRHGKRLGGVSGMQEGNAKI